MSNLTLKEQLEQLKIRQKLPEHKQETHMKDIPAEAVTFQLAPVSFQDTDPATDNKPPRFHMQAYSGDMLADHWYWGDLIIDLEGMTLPNKPIPSLRDHDPGQIIGWTDKIDKSNGTVDVEGVFSQSTAAGKEALALARENFPWQASVYVPTSSIEEVKKDEDVTVNGHALKGPVTIFRKTQLAEVSFCALGADSNTSAVAMAHKGAKLQAETIKKGEKTMDIKTLMTDHPEIMEQFRKDAIKEITVDNFSDEVKAKIDEAVSTERDRIIGLYVQGYGQEEAGRFGKIITPGATVTDMLAFATEKAKKEMLTQFQSQAPGSQGNADDDAGEGDGGDGAAPKTYEKLCEDYKVAHKCSEGTAMAAIAREHPIEHDAYLLRVNTRS